MQEKLQDKGSARRAASKPPNDAPKSPANSFSSAKTVLRAMRIARALHLRGLGFTHAEIGDEEGYSESTACRLVKEGMACLTTGRPAKELLAAELSVSIAFAVAVALPVFCAVNGSRAMQRSITRTPMSRAARLSVLNDLYWGWADLLAPCINACISSGVRRPSLLASIALKMRS